jgi:hypothetical protein
VESSGGFQVWKFVGWVVLPRGCWGVWSRVVEDYKERLGELLQIP